MPKDSTVEIPKRMLRFYFASTLDQNECDKPKFCNMCGDDATFIMSSDETIDVCHECKFKLHLIRLRTKTVTDETCGIIIYLFDEYSVNGGTCEAIVNTPTHVMFFTKNIIDPVLFHYNQVVEEYKQPFGIFCNYCGVSCGSHACEHCIANSIRLSISPQFSFKFKLIDHLMLERLETDDITPSVIHLWVLFVLEEWNQSASRTLTVNYFGGITWV
jgi:hypothetical protein